MGIPAAKKSSESWATSLAARRATQANRRRDTQPELRLRSELHRLGLRFRVDFPLRLQGRLIHPDVAFRRARVAVFLDGCFWHRCPEHGSAPAANASYWGPKLDRNVARDRLTDALLDAGGWISIRVWEHEPPASAAQRIAEVVVATGDVGSVRPATRASGTSSARALDLPSLSTEGSVRRGSPLAYDPGGVATA